MRRILTLLLILLTVPGGVATAQSVILVSTPETSKDGVSARVQEDSAGGRELAVLVPAGRFLPAGHSETIRRTLLIMSMGIVGHKPSPHFETIRSEDVTARAFDETGKELGLIDTHFNGFGGLVVSCSGGCWAIKYYSFSVPKAQTDGVWKVVVMFRNKQYELTMETYSPPNRAN